MRFLFIGDIVGKPGRRIVTELLPKIRKKKKYDLVIANGENLSHGKGINQKVVDEMQKAGVDFFTSGNHVWKQKKTLPLLNDTKFPVIRPANYPPGVPGRGYHIVETGLMKRILVMNLMGRVFFGQRLDCPFRLADQILTQTASEHLSAIIVDFHAEATSEKVALGHYLTGKVSAVLGTHTHIPTADPRILQGHTAYLTDVGMCGLRDSIIGVDKEQIIKHFLTQLPVPHDISTGPMILNAVEFEIDDQTGRATKIESVLKEIEE